MKPDSTRDEKKCDLGSRDKINVRVGMNLIRSVLVTLRDTGTASTLRFCNSDLDVVLAHNPITMSTVRTAPSSDAALKLSKM